MDPSSRTAARHVPLLFRSSFPSCIRKKPEWAPEGRASNYDLNCYGMFVVPVVCRNIVVLCRDNLAQLVLSGLLLTRHLLPSTCRGLLDLIYA